MTQFVALTKKGGQTVHVNLEQVEFIEAQKDGSRLVFMRLPWMAADDDLSVLEAPETILQRVQSAA